MIFDPKLLDQLQSLDPTPWAGQAYRYIVGENLPTKANTRGARWNPPSVAAIYTALDRETLLAELDYRLSLDVVRPKEIFAYTISIELHNVLDLTPPGVLADVGLSMDELGDIDYRRCQEVGGAVDWLEHDGLLVPSARADGSNLVVFPTNQHAEAVFEVLSEEQL